MPAFDGTTMDVSKLRQHLCTENLKILRRPTPRQMTAPYLPILLAALMIEERITFPLFLKVSEGEEEEIRFLPYLQEGEILQLAWVESLLKAGIERLYFHEQDLDRAVAYLNNHLLLTSAGPANYREKFCILREHLSLSLYRALNKPHLAATVRMVKKSLEHLARFMEKKDFPWKLVWEMIHRDYTLYNHSVNVGLMGMAFMGFLGKSGKDRLLVGLAGLFHDVGLTHLKEEVIPKTRPLTDAEQEVLKRHPTLGYRLLKNNPEIPVDSLRLILEHHESADGCGYPNGLPLRRQHPYTRILFILEIYDGLTTFRPDRPAHTPFAALRILQDQQSIPGLACDPRAIKQFIQFLALA
uniref:HD domain-containing protein n=1 Tax=Desulfobacca acetoxidans TaxID=60893 RepID=A0A7V6A6D2_9BACT